MPNQRLEQLADDLDRATSADRFDARAELVGAFDSPDESSKGALAFVDLDCDHPSDRLIGFTAPDDWWAIGLISAGWAGPSGGSTPYSSGYGPISGHPDATRVWMLVLVGRDGQSACRARLADGRSISTPGEGYLADLLRRTMGLPTPPATATSTEFLTALWLGEIEGAALDAQAKGRRVGWRRVAQLHPALRLLEADGLRLNPDNDLVPAAQAMGKVFTWARVREQCEKGWLPDLVASDAARWMDEGMLSRYLMSALPPIGVLVPQIMSRLRTDAARRLGHALCALGVDGVAAA